MVELVMVASVWIVCVTGLALIRMSSARARRGDLEGAIELLGAGTIIMFFVCVVAMAILYFALTD